MKYIISGKNMTVKPGLKDHVIGKMSKLEKFFTEDTEAQITFSTQKKDAIIEVTIPIKGTTIRGEERASTMHQAIDEVVEILERQLLKHRKKIISRHRQAKELRFDYFEQDHAVAEEGIKIVRSKRFAMKPMDPEEACMEMDLLGHDFFVFRNADTDEVNVVYKRRHGAYGLIEPEI